jgi:hypothetical protein
MKTKLTNLALGATLALTSSALAQNTSPNRTRTKSRATPMSDDAVSQSDVLIAAPPTRWRRLLQQYCRAAKNIALSPQVSLMGAEARWKDAYGLENATAFTTFPN